MRRVRFVFGMTFQARSLEFEVGLGGGDLSFNFYVGAVRWVHTSLLLASLAGFLSYSCLFKKILRYREPGLVRLLQFWTVS